MGEAEALGVLAQAHRELSVAEPTIALFRNARPGAGMHFVDVERLARDIALGAGFEPGIVVPSVVGASYARSRERGRLHLVRPRIGLDSQQAFLGFELVLV